MTSGWQLTGTFAGEDLVFPLPFHGPRFDVLSFVVTPVELLFGGSRFSHGTGFIWRQDSGTYFLITNWHNLAGKNPETGELLDAQKGFVPSAVRLYPTVTEAGRYTRQEVTIALYEHYDQPCWLQYKHFEKIRVDIAALTLPQPGPFLALQDYGFEKLTTLVGSDLFIPGYPFLPLEQLGTRLPVWKRGSLASEPLAGWNGRPAFMIDAASRPGMSGSPVFRRTFGPAAVAEQDGSVSIAADRVLSTDFVGVYAGHLSAADEKITIGFAWYGSLVGEVVDQGVPGTRL
jgi:hypothetical protein